MVRRWARSLLPVVVLVLGGCSPPPDEVTTGGTGSSDTSAGAITITLDTTVATMRPVEDSSGTPPSETAMDTTMGAVDGTTSETSDGSSGSPPGCGDGPSCGSNEVCDNDRCVEACGGLWGVGSYGYCLDEFGAFDTSESCGRDHLCVYWGDPITGTACARQDCVDACDCPPPTDSGNATVTCGQITDPPEGNDCFLSCKSGETCPDGMFCAENGACTNDVPELATYGDCGNVASTCAAPGSCFVDGASGATVCTTGCVLAGDCPIPIPPGGNPILACSELTFDTMGFECYVSCIGGLICPDGMTCVNGTLCMWPD